MIKILILFLGIFPAFSFSIDRDNSDSALNLIKAVIENQRAVNLVYDAKAVMFSKQAMKDSSFLKKIAIYGMDSMKKAALGAIMKFSNTNAKGFNSKEEALKWLVS